MIQELNIKKIILFNKFEIGKKKEILVSIWNSVVVDVSCVDVNGTVVDNKDVVDEGAVVVVVVVVVVAAADVVVGATVVVVVAVVVAAIDVDGDAVLVSVVVTGATVDDVDVVVCAVHNNTRVASNNTNIVIMLKF